MQVFKAFMKIVLKHLNIAFIYIVVFFIMAVIMSNVGTSQTEQFSASKLNVCVIDMDNSASSKKLTEYIGKNHNLVDIENNKDDILNALYYRTADYVLNIKEGYEKNLSNGNTEDLLSNYKVPDSYNAVFMDSQLDSYVKYASAYISGGMSVEKALDKVSDELSDEVKVETISFNDTTEPKDTRYLYFSSLGYIMVMVIVMAVAPSFMSMTNKKIRSRTNCSAITSSSQTMQLVIGAAICGTAVFVMFALGGFIFLGDMMYTSTGLLMVLNLFVYTVFSIMLTLFISTIIENATALNMIANVLGLGMSFLGGVFVSQDLLSEGVLSVGRFLPSYWYVRAVNIAAGACGEVFDLGQYFISVGIVFGFALVMMALTLLAAKTKRKSSV